MHPDCLDQVEQEVHVVSKDLLDLVESLDQMGHQEHLEQMDVQDHRDPLDLEENPVILLN